MKILIVEPRKQPRVAEINGTLQSMQQIVDGCIQAIIGTFQAGVEIFDSPLLNTIIM